MARTHEQLLAETQLLRALNRCHDAGYRGGVFDGQFCLWPKTVDPHDDDNFFQTVENQGRILRSPMALDGGAGC
jgi:hypothetical protein